MVFEELATLGTLVWVAMAVGGIVGYIYGAFVWSTIAKKLNYDKPWLAWIPFANMFLIPILAKKKWTWGFIIFVPIVGTVFYMMWGWNIYEQRNYPGWLILIPLLGFIPVIGSIVGIVNLVIMGLVAWKDRV